MNVCRRDLDGTKDMPFLIKDEKFLETYNEIWVKVSNISKTEFNSEPVHNKNI